MRLDHYYFAWESAKHPGSAGSKTTHREWQFSSWSNGGNATQDIIVPDDSEINGMRI
jgi:hypothetical protein